MISIRFINVLLPPHSRNSKQSSIKKTHAAFKDNLTAGLSNIAVMAGLSHICWCAGGADTKLGDIT